MLLPWQVEVMRLIWDAGGEIDSRTAHNRLKGSATQVSRASAINFLKKMAGEGFLEHREVTSKGAGNGCTGRAALPQTRMASGGPSPTGSSTG